MSVSYAMREKVARAEARQQAEQKATEQLKKELEHERKLEELSLLTDLNSP
jgi:hypothetical protein